MKISWLRKETVKSLSDKWASLQKQTSQEAGQRTAQSPEEEHGCTCSKMLASLMSARIKLWLGWFSPVRTTKNMSFGCAWQWGHGCAWQRTLRILPDASGHLEKCLSNPQAIQLCEPTWDHLPSTSGVTSVWYYSWWHCCKSREDRNDVMSVNRLLGKWTLKHPYNGWLNAKANIRTWDEAQDLVFLCRK
jgi:hypothetical protein